MLRPPAKGRSRSAPAARGRTRDNAPCVAGSRLPSLAPQRVLVEARGGGDPTLDDRGGVAGGGQGEQEGEERWRQKEAEVTFAWYIRALPLSMHGVARWRMLCCVVSPFI